MKHKGNLFGYSTCYISTGITKIIPTLKIILTSKESTSAFSIDFV